MAPTGASARPSEASPKESDCAGEAGARTAVITTRHWLMTRSELRVLAFLVVTVFRLWDGRVIEATEWIRHGEEYVVTLRDGATRILRQQEVREVAPGAERPATAPSAPSMRPATPRERRGP